MMKRFATVMLSFMMLLSIGANPAYAANESELLNIPIEIDYEGDIDIFSSDVSNNPIKLSSEASYDTYAGEIDLSNAVNVTTDVLGKSDIFDSQDVPSLLMLSDFVVPLDLPENQPPVASPELLVLNPGSMKDGQFTTETEILIVTRYNNIDLCYDPEGGSINFLTDSFFPKGYWEYRTYNGGSLAGYRIHIFNAGSYPLAFCFIDEYGGASDIFGVNFEIVPRGTFETIDGELTSATDVVEYPITVDFSAADEYCVGFLRTGTGGFGISAYYEDGTYCSAQHTTGPNRNQRIGAKIDLKRPDGVNGEYTFTLKITTSDADYVEGDTTYRIVYGEASQKYYFFEDISNCIELPYYTAQSGRNLKAFREVFSQWSPTSTYGHYYKITATGPEVVTLASFYAEHRFMILDCDTLQVLYDGSSLDHIDYGDNLDPNPFYYSTGLLNFEAGTSYYVVVYGANNVDYPNYYSIRVGDRAVIRNTVEFEAPIGSVSANTSYSFNLTIGTPSGRAGYIDTVQQIDHVLGLTPTVEVRTPGTQNWVNVDSFRGRDFGYLNTTNPPVRADGTWEFRLTFSKSGNFNNCGFCIYYWFEV